MITGFRFSHPNEADTIFTWDLTESLVYRNGKPLVALHRGTLNGELLYRFLRYTRLSNFAEARESKEQLSEIEVRIHKPKMLDKLGVKRVDRDAFVANIHGYGYQWLAKAEPLQATSSEKELVEPADKEEPAPILGKNLFLGKDETEKRRKAPAALLRHIIESAETVAEKSIDFVGRRFVFEAIDRFSKKQDRGYFVIEGDPGIGKTALMASLLLKEPCAHHFNIRGEGINRSDRFLANLCAQLIIKYELSHVDLPAQATQDAAFLKEILSEIGTRLAADEKVMILVDALDEVEPGDASGGANTLFLPLTLPRGFYVVVTTRRTEEVRLHFNCPTETFPIKHNAPTNMSDVTAYILKKLRLPGIDVYIKKQNLQSKEFVEGMAKHSEGNFMYLRHVLPEVASGAYHKRPLGWIPNGLMKYYEDHWWRMRGLDETAWNEVKVPVVVALTIVREPVSMDLIAGFSKVSDRRAIRSVLRDWKQFLHISLIEEENQKRYRIYHGSYQDFIRAKDEVQDENEGRGPIVDEVVDLKAAHKNISDFLINGLQEMGILDESFDAED